MNADRRKRLDEAATLLDQAQQLISTVAEEEQEAFDNLNEGLQAAERGQRMEEVAGALADLAQEIDTAAETCREMQE